MSYSAEHHLTFDHHEAPEADPATSRAVEEVIDEFRERHGAAMSYAMLYPLVDFVVDQAKKQGSKTEKELADATALVLLEWPLEHVMDYGREVAKNQRKPA